eukprot:1275970-Amorphochlora_amoeboformis.AAC.1
MGKTSTSRERKVVERKFRETKTIRRKPAKHTHSRLESKPPKRTTFRHPPKPTVFAPPPKPIRVADVEYKTTEATTSTRTESTPAESKFLAVPPADSVTQIPEQLSNTLENIVSQLEIIRQTLQ